MQELAGHSSPNLTARYSHRHLHDLAGAVERLPNFLPGAEAQALRATGTDGFTGPATGPKLAPAVDGGSGRVTAEAHAGWKAQPLTCQGI